MHIWQIDVKTMATIFYRPLTQVFPELIGCMPLDDALVIEVYVNSLGCVAEMLPDPYCESATIKVLDYCMS